MGSFSKCQQVLPDTFGHFFITEQLVGRFELLFKMLPQKQCFFRSRFGLDYRLLCGGGDFWLGLVGVRDFWLGLVDVGDFLVGQDGVKDFWLGLVPETSGQG